LHVNKIVLMNLKELKAVEKSIELNKSGTQMGDFAPDDRRALTGRASSEKSGRQPANVNGIICKRYNLQRFSDKRGTAMRHSIILCICLTLLICDSSLAQEAGTPISSPGQRFEVLVFKSAWSHKLPQVPSIQKELDQLTAGGYRVSSFPIGNWNQ